MSNRVPRCRSEIMGQIARAFEIVNRIFGWGTAVAGVSVLLGVVYIRAPLYRTLVWL